MRLEDWLLLRPCLSVIRCDSARHHRGRPINGWCRLTRSERGPAWTPAFLSCCSPASSDPDSLCIWSTQVSEQLHVVTSSTFCWGLLGSRERHTHRVEGGGCNRKCVRCLCVIYPSVSRDSLQQEEQKTSVRAGTEERDVLTSRSGPQTCWFGPTGCVAVMKAQTGNASQLRTEMSGLHAEQQSRSSTVCLQQRLTPSQ